MNASDTSSNTFSDVMSPTKRLILREFFLATTEIFSFRCIVEVADSKAFVILLHVAQESEVSGQSSIFTLRTCGFWTV